MGKAAGAGGQPPGPAALSPLLCGARTAERPGTAPIPRGATDTENRRSGAHTGAYGHGRAEAAWCSALSASRHRCGSGARKRPAPAAAGVPLSRGGGTAFRAHPPYRIGRATGFGECVGPGDVLETLQPRPAQRQAAQCLVLARPPGVCLARGHPHTIGVSPLARSRHGRLSACRHRLPPLPTPPSGFTGVGTGPLPAFRGLHAPGAVPAPGHPHKPACRRRYRHRPAPISTVRPRRYRGRRGRWRRSCC